MPPEAATIEAPDTSAPVTTETPTILGANPHETFRNAMKAEADAAGARSQRTDPDTPTPESKSPETVKAKTEAKSPETVKPSADDIPESLLKPAVATEKTADDAPPELPASTSKSVREHFQKQGEYFKTKLAKTSEEVATLRQQLEAAASSNGKPSADHIAALEAVTKQRDELNARLERIAYQESPAFHEKFTAREERLRGVAEKIFEDVGADKSILSQALAMSGKRRDEFLDEQDIGATTKARLASVLGQLDVLADERTADVATSREKLSTMRAQEMAQQKAAEERQTAEEKSVLQGILKTASETGIAFRKVEGNDAWNKAVEERLEMVNQLAFGNNDIKTVMEHAVAAVEAKVIGRLNEKLMAENAALREKVAGMSAVEPGMNGRDKPAASDEERIAKMSPDERARDTFRRLAAPFVGH
jgi:hypothetical protein